MDDKVDPLKPVSDAADLIGKHGSDVVFTSLWVVLIASAISLAVWYTYRRLNGSYIHVDKIIDYLKENNSKVLRKEWNELPDLRSHQVFGAWQKELRESATVIVCNKDGSDSKLKTDLARDVISWSIRGYRDVIKTLLNLAYKDKDGFENYFGNSKECLRLVENTYLDANDGVRVRLIEELGFPVIVWEKLSRLRNKHHELMNKMFVLAINNHDVNYYRINEILNSYYAAADSISSAICSCISLLDLDDITYDRLAEAALTTRNSSQPIPEQSKYAPRIFEGMYNPKSR
jgi:hypothetical protein